MDTLRLTCHTLLMGADNDSQPAELDPTREAFAGALSKLPPPQHIVRSALAVVDLNPDNIHIIHGSADITEDFDTGTSITSYTPTPAIQIYIARNGEPSAASSLSDEERTDPEVAENNAFFVREIRDLLSESLQGNTSAEAAWLRRAGASLEEPDLFRSGEVAQLIDDCCPGVVSREQQRTGLYQYWNGTIIEIQSEAPFDDQEYNWRRLDAPLPFFVHLRTIDGTVFSYVLQEDGNEELSITKPGDLPPNPLGHDTDDEDEVGPLLERIKRDTEIRAENRQQEAYEPDGDTMSRMTIEMQAAFASGLVDITD
jgi:hypothetical protein